jgi:hypothetical protein
MARKTVKKSKAGSRMLPLLHPDAAPLRRRISHSPLTLYGFRRICDSLPDTVNDYRSYRPVLNIAART